MDEIKKQENKKKKRDNEQQKAAKKKIRLFGIVKSLILVILLGTYSLLPLQKIGSFSIGNAWNHLAYFKKYSELFLIALSIIGVFVLEILSLLGELLDSKNGKLNLQEKYRLFFIPFAVGFVIIAVLGLIAAKQCFKKYSLDSTMYSIIYIFYIIATLSESIFTQIVIKRQISSAIQYQRKKTTKWTMLSKIIKSFIFPVAVCFVITAYATPATFPTKYRFEKGVPLEYSTQDLKQLSEQIKLDMDKIQENAFIDKVTENFYSKEYIYYDDLTKKLQKQIDNFWTNQKVQDDDLEKLAKLETKYLRLKESMNILKEKQVKNYGYIQTTYTSYLNQDGSKVLVFSSASYNANKNGSPDETKWKKKKDFSDIFAKEEILLSQTTFEQGTNFSTYPILANIKYNDGSIKTSLITVSNAEHLSNAQTGRQSLKWSDEWGTYEIIITII